MAHTIGSLPTRSTVQTADPTTLSVTVAEGETVMCVMIKTVGSTNRSGGPLKWGVYPLTQAGSTQKAAASPEASAEMHYLLNPPPGTATLSIPNTGGLSIYVQVAFGRAGAGMRTAFDTAAVLNGTSTNPTTSFITCRENGNIVFGCVAGGWTTWAPSAQSGTNISNNDDGAHGWGSQYALRATTAAFSVDWTFGTSDDWGAVSASFREVPTVRLNHYQQPRVEGGLALGTDRLRGGWGA